MSERMKQWRCKNQHIIGFIRWNGSDLPQLMVLREALDMEVENPQEVDAMGPLDGRMPIRCSICDDVQVWEVSAPTLVMLISRLSNEQVFEFSRLLLEKSSRMVDLGDPATPPPAPPQMSTFGEGRKAGE
jgi:hypothetical protein